MTAEGGQVRSEAGDIAAIEWVSASELVGLPGIPGTKRGILKTADREGWLFREQTTRGGTARVFAVTSLPPLTRAALLQRRGVEPSPEPASPSNAPLWERFERLPGRKQEEARRRLGAILRYEALVAGGMSRRQAQAAVAGQIGESDRTLRNWLKLIEGVARGDRLPHLAPAHAGGLRTAEITPEAWDRFKSYYLSQSEPAATACYEWLQRDAREHGWTIPSLATLMRRLEREIPRPALVFARQGEEALKRCYPPQIRSRAHLRAMEAVNIDGHKFDVRVRWEDGTVARPILVPIQDLYSNKYLAWRLGPSETSELVRLVIGDVVERYGIFDKIYMDNGRGFAAKLISGGAPTRFRFKTRPEDPTGLLTSLDVEIHWTTPYSGQSKPIERSFRDLSVNRIAKHPLCEGAYVGSSPERKPENAGTRVVPIAEFRKLVDEEIRQYNARPNRRTEVCGGVRSFDEAFAASYEASRHLIRRPTESQLRTALLAADAVSTQRETGAIRLFQNLYWTPALSQLAGTRVMVRFDPDDLSKPVHVYRLDGTYIASAPRQEAAGFDDVAAAKEQQKKRGAFIRAQKAVARAERAYTGAELARLMAQGDAAPPPPMPTPVVAGAFTVARQPKPEIGPLEAGELLHAFLKQAKPDREEPL